METRKRKQSPLPNEEPKEKKTKMKTEQCKACKQEKVLLMHLGKSPKCRDHYPNFEEMKKNSNKNCKNTYRLNNKEKISESNKANYQKNKEKISLQQKTYKATNRKALLEKQRERDQRRKSSRTSEERIRNFKNDIKNGLAYICQSCARQLFRHSIKILTENQTTELKKKCESSFLKTVLPKINLRLKDPLLVLCHNCHSKIKSNKIPKINISNGFALDDVPEELRQLTDLEQQLIAKVLLFMKVLPMTKKFKKFKMIQIPKIIDRVINVPLHDEDVSKTISSLPRSLEDAAIVDVQFKRKVDMKNTHHHAFVSPSKLLKALRKLKGLNNPYYIDVKTDMTQWNSEINDTNPSDESDTEDNEDGDSDEEAVDRGGFGTNAKTLTDADTCLVPENLESEVIVAGDNTDAAKSIKLAPGKKFFSNINL